MTDDTRHWRMYAGFGGAILVLFALLGFALDSVSRLAGALESNLETYDAIHAAHRGRASIELINAGFGGFLFSRTDESLSLIDEGERQFRAALGEVERVSGIDPEQRSRIARAREAQMEWRRQSLDPTIEAVRAIAPDGTPMDADGPHADYDPAAMLAQQELYGTYLGEIYGLLEEIGAAERARLEARAASVDWLETAAFWLIGLGGVIGAGAAGAFATVGVRRSRALAAVNRTLRDENLERQRAEVALERVSRRNALILEAAGEGICGLDTNGRIIFINPAASEMLGVTEEEAMFRGAVSILFRDPARTAAAAQVGDSLYVSMQDGTIHHAALDHFRRTDGSEFPVEYITRPIVEAGGITGCVLTFRDITERHQVERLKDEFVSVVSHELRTPLTSIRGSLGLLASGMLGTLHERGQRMLEIAAQNTDRLVRLINDILDIERIESGSVEMKPRTTEIRTVIDQAVSSVAVMAEKSEITIEIAPAEAQVYVDPDRVVQVITNLLSNAIKFSGAGSVVSVSTRDLDGLLQVTVADQGRGIPAEQLEKIFGRFQQVDASDSREKGGTGLGLAIARSIVSQHGGDIWVESEPGVGSAFHFTLPLRSTGERSPAGAGPTVLLCDDDEITLAVVGEQLRAGGYHVLTAADGEEAIALARQRLPDAILLDLVMPGMDGCSIMMELKQHSETRSIPIIIFSSTPRDGDLPGLEDVADWVTKNAGVEALIGALERALARGTQIGRVMLVEDDLDLAEVLVTMFRTHGVDVLHTDNYADAVRLSGQAPPDLLILDIVLREGDAFDLVDSFRRDDQLRSVPLVVYSALDIDDDQRSRLRLGPTEFMTKGRVSPSEFERRVIALLDELLTAEAAGV